MTRRRPNVLCLDLGGVVVRICRSWAEGCNAASVVPREPLDALDEAVARTISECSNQLQSGSLEFDEYARRTAAALGDRISAEDVTSIHDSWILGDYDGVRDLLHRISASGVKVACLSNTNARHWEQMTRTSEAFAAIPHRFASHDLGLVKPARGIYEAFERAMGCTGDDILFLDDLEENIAAASGCGWHAVRIDPHQPTALQIEAALVSFGAMRAIDIPSPLSVETITGATEPGGLIKARPSDFLVDEIPGVEPSGEGEHLLLGVHKEDMMHDELLRVIAKHYGVDLSAVGHAGIKDRRAVTRQTLSVNIPRGEPATVLTHDRMVILWSRRHSSKLRKGQLLGNRFAIRVRAVDPLRAPTILARLRRLEREGVPNAFGPQRFGNRLNNHRLGLLALEERWEDFVAELTGMSNLPCPTHQIAAREACDAGLWDKSVPLWGAGDIAERKVALALSRGTKPARAIKALGGEPLRFFISALQSAIFNRVLDERLRAGTLATLLDGEIAFRHATGQCLKVEEGASELIEGAKRLELSPTGPLPGARLLEPTGVALEMERAAAAAFGVDATTFVRAPFPPPGSRRPLRIPIANASLEAGTDEHGGYIKVAFDLPPGAFATTVLTELFGEVRSAGDSATHLRDGT